MLSCLGSFLDFRRVVNFSLAMVGRWSASALIPSLKIGLALSAEGVVFCALIDPARMRIRAVIR